MDGVNSSQGPGRPRNPDIDARIRKVALELFGSSGWNGLTMGAIAEAAGVGKPSLYRRWPSKGAVVADALRSIRTTVRIDTGFFAGDLRQFCRLMADEFIGPYGPALARYAVEAKFTPEVGDEYGEMVKGRVAETTGIVERAIQRGEVIPAANPSVIISVIHGAVLDWVLFSQVERERIKAKDVEGFVDDLVESILHGVSADIDREAERLR